ncbi:MAG: hypothetical protein KY434_02170 [Actinobacteria bacterium]|nr:hypothetical protein [Actinomycetota bacterium]
MHVADLADAHVLALEPLHDHGRMVCNIGNGTGVSVREVVEAARRVTGRDVVARERPRRPGDPAMVVASADRARSPLGWRPDHTDLDGIVASAWRWHRRRWDRRGAPRRAG